MTEREGMDLREKEQGRIVIECPNTIFYLYVRNEIEMTKVEIFMNNIRTVNRLGIADIYNWCNRQGIAYDTRFNYHRKLSLWSNLRSFLRYNKNRVHTRYPERKIG